MRKLVVGITADPGIPVPPVHYGGIERIIHLLVRELVARGHEVVLFADRASSVPCELVPFPGHSVSATFDVARNAAAIAAAVVRRHFDVVHSFGRLAYLAPLALTTVPKVMSYQRTITPSSVLRARRLFGDTIEFTACSRSLTIPVAGLADWHVVYNGVPIEAYRFAPHVGALAPLVFLGRLAPEKGAHVAIEVARRAGRRLIIAGNVVDEHRGYFDERIRPALKSSGVEYVGPIDDAGKNDLLGQAAGLLMPILWDEPFGIVMAEALACGTPVVGFRRASVPEVVADGVTGFLADDEDGLVEGVHGLASIDRRRCRLAAESRFSAQAIVADYEAIYARCAHQQRVSA